MVKKRYMVTLTEENVEKLKAFYAQGGLPASTFSSTLDELVKGVVATIETLTQKSVDSGKPLTFGETLAVIGAIADKMDVPEVPSDKKKTRSTKKA